MNKKIWSAPIALIVVLVTALIFGGITVSADTIASGECGASATWTLDSEGTLTIGGTGDMADYNWNSAPWYSQAENIKAIVIEDGITGIGARAFMNLSNAASVSIGSGVTSIGYEAFYNDIALTSVTIPDNVKSMNSEAFEYCRELTTVTFSGQSTITEIPYGCFAYCNKLSSVNIPDSVTTIGGYAFSDCNFTELTVPSNITTIGESAYRNCDGLTSVTMSEGVTTVLAYAFAYCDNLATVDFPNTLTEIGYQAFYSSGLTSVVLPDQPVSIGDQAFAFCEHLETACVTLADYCQGSGMFSTCTNLKTATIKGNPQYFGYNTFNSCVNLTSVTIPDSVEVIYGFTFKNCSKLENITLPSGLKDIKSQCFEDCTSLKSIVLPETLEVIGSYAFSNSGLTSVTIPAKVNIGEDAFSRCDNLQDVTIDAGVTSIPNYAFSGCLSLKTVSIPDTVTSIGYAAFASSGIESVVIPDSVITIDECAFYNCHKLKSVTIGEGVETIGQLAFYFCNALESITIPGTVKIVNVETFAKCYSLKYLELGEGVEEIWQNAFCDCTSLETIILPSTIIDMRYQAFYGCCCVRDIYCNAAWGFNWDDDGDDFKDPGLKSTICHVGEGLAGDFAALYSDVNVTFVDGTISDARLVGHSITLSADIGVNFFIRLPEGYDSSNTKVTFTWGYGDRARTVKGELVSVNQYGANYKVTCGVAACEMGDEITMVVKSGKKELITDEYSVLQYINVLGHSSEYYELQDLIASMVFYGSSSQVYFDYRTDHYLLDVAEISSDAYSRAISYILEVYYDNANPDATPDPAWMTIKDIENDDLGIKYYATSVICGSQTKVRFYFEVTDQAKFDNLTASYNSQSLSFKNRTLGGKDLVYIETPGLAAGAIESAITVKIGGNNYSYDYRYYLRQCITNSEYGDFAETALYLYAVSHFARIYQESLG